MWELKVCRCCLSTESRLCRINENTKRTYITVTGLQISEGDGFPTHLCEECFVQIRKCQAFRRKSRRAYFALKTVMTQQKQLTCDNIRLINRNNANLCSALNHWEPQSNGFFTYMEKEVEDSNDDSGDFLTKLARARDESILSQYLMFPETKTKDVLTKYIPEMNSVTVIVTDIKTSNYEELERAAEERKLKKEAEEEEERKRIELEKLAAMPMQDFNNDFESDEDYFNDGEEKNSPVNLTPKEETELIMEKIANKKAENRIKLTDCKPSLKSAFKYDVPKNLLNVRLRYLTRSEQIAGFQSRLQAPKFRSAALKCSVCVEIFYALSDLLEHVKKHNNKSATVFKCSICHDKLLTQRQLEWHSFSHWYEYRCKICTKTCYYIGDIKTLCNCVSTDNPTMAGFRMQKLNQEEMLAAFATFEDRERTLCCSTKDVGSQSPTSDRFKCDICDASYVQLKRLEAHMIRWHRYKFVCNTCGCTVFNRTAALRHNCEVQKGTTATTSLKCQYCDKDLKTATEAIKHYSKSHSMVHYKHHCSECGLKFNIESQMFEHQLRNHKIIRLGIKELCDERCYCAECDYYFVDQAALNNHLVYMGHEAAKDVPNACSKCRIVFKREGTLETHACYRHKLQKTIFPKDIISEKIPKRNYLKQCCYCDEAFVSAWDYRRHFLEKHPGLNYKAVTQMVLCELCGVSVWHKGIERHMQLHSGTIGFRCKICKENLSTPTLYIHHVLRHTPHPYICIICGHRNKHRCEARDHVLKTHAPVSPYECGACSRRFTHLDFLQAHCLKVHKLDLKHSQPQVFNTYPHSSAKFYVYPHMKVVATHMDPEIVAQANVELCDYMGNTTRCVDYREHFLFDIDDQPVLLRVPRKDSKRTRIKKRRGPRKKVKVDIKDGNLTIKIDDLDQTINQEDFTEHDKKIKRRRTKDKISSAVEQDSEFTGQDSEITGLHLGLIGQDSGITGQDMELTEQHCTGFTEQDLEFTGQDLEFTGQDSEFTGQDSTFIDQDAEITKQISIITGQEAGLEAESMAVDCNEEIFEKEIVQKIQESQEIDYTEELHEVIEMDGKQFVCVDGALYELCFNRE